MNKMIHPYSGYTKQYSHTTGYSVIKRTEALIHAVIWMGLENILSEKSQSQETIYCMIPFIQNLEANLETERSVVAKGREG